MTDLCPDHAHAATTCLAKTGHHPESRAAERLRADLAKQCTPGIHCPPLTRPAQETT